MKRKFGFFAFAALLAGAVLAFGLSACSSGGDDTAAVMALAAASGGTSQTGTSSDSGTQSGGTNPTTTTPETIPTPTVTYVITFNANDGSENPSTVTQNFTAGIAQALIPVEELGFSKAGFSFAGWGRAPKSKQASYADGASYTATANETLYALWSEIPVYSVYISANVRGTVTASPATGTAGTEITLSNTPNEGYQFVSYAVTHADGTAVIVPVTDGKFTMPAKNVTVTAVFAALTYTITFNANDGSPSPATATQTFTAGTPQNLKTIAGLGFTKEGFNFAGWGISADASQASYADGASYTGTAASTLYALWSEIPVYSVNIPVNANGSVTANPATATAGMEITLSNTPKTGYKFVSYSVTDADGAVVTVNDGKFTMPAKNVTVAATFSAINYNINVGTFSNGRVTASPTTATFGTSVTLTASPASGCELAKMIVTDSDGISVAVNGTGNSRTFAMPAKNVTVTAIFSAIQYNINIGTIANGSVMASPETATAGTEITLSNTPNAGYKFAYYTVRGADGAVVAVADGKFTMPAKNVTVSAAFTAINYNITIGTFANGSVTASPASATVGTSVTLTASPAFGYGLATLTVSAADGTSVSVNGTGDSRTFVMPAQNVTVTDATFAEIPAASGAYTKIGTTEINGTQYDLVTFGLWPQTIKSAAVTIDDSQRKTSGAFTYRKGGDGQWYVKIKENACKSDFYYSDGTIAAQSSANSYKWFKVEPIKWRVLTINYNGTGKRLLLAENILKNCEYYDGSGIRTVSENNVYSNNYEHSKLRAFLNGLSYQKKSSDVQTACDDFLGKGFLQTAFNDVELAKIVDTSVVNIARSTLPDDYDSWDESLKKNWNNGKNVYASNIPTNDKIFLLSAQEATKSEYGLNVSNVYNASRVYTSRVRKATDYAKACGVTHGDGVTYGGGKVWGGWWWLRSPCHNGYVVRIENNGDTGRCAEFHNVISSIYGGVVPALCVED